MAAGVLKGLKLFDSVLEKGNYLYSTCTLVELAWKRSGQLKTKQRKQTISRCSRAASQLVQTLRKHFRAPVRVHLSVFRTQNKASTHRIESDCGAPKQQNRKNY